MTAAVREAKPQQQQPRPLPHNADAERSLLGGILLDPASVDELAELVQPQDLYRTAHRKIFEAMLALAGRSEAIDRVTLKAELARGGVLASVGGDDAIDELDSVVPSASNLAWYARTVADLALRRRVLETARAILEDGHTGEGTAREFADRSEGRLFEAASHRQAGGFTSAASMYPALLRDLERSYETGTGLTGQSTGLRALDEITLGLQAGDLVVIGARPSMGKSALALDFARAVAGAGGTVAFFSLEMPAQQQEYRLASVEARVDLARLRSGRLLEPDWGRLAGAAARIGRLPIEFDDTARSLSEIRARSRRLAARQAGTDQPLRAVVVDYLQLMDHGADKGEREDQAIARSTRGLKALAKSLQVPVVLLSQLNRGVEQRPDKRPRMSDLRESGSIEQDADLVLFPYRPEVYEPNAAKGAAEILVGKHRNGPTGVAHVAFLHAFASFADAESAAADRQQRMFERGEDER